MTDILDQIEAEDPEDEALKPDVSHSSTRQRPRPDSLPLQAEVSGDYFQHFACLYIKYCQIFKKLHECYDQVGPLCIVPLFISSIFVNL